MKSSISRSGGRALLVTAAAISGAALVAGCGPLGSSAAHSEPGGGGYSAQAPASGGTSSGTSGTSGSPGSPGSSDSSLAGEQTLDVWGSDGCLEYLILDSADDTVAVSATNLCRTTVTSFPGSALAGSGTFYAYFPRGRGTSGWQAVAGQGNDGNDYWEYNDGELYRGPADGGSAQLEVQESSGQLDFEDEGTFLQQNPKGLPFIQSVREDLAAQTIAQEEIGMSVQRNPQLPGGATAEYSQAQDNISTQNQQARQYGQTYQGATQGGVSPAQESLIVTQAQMNENKIWDAPDCIGSDNVEAGCGGANAFNDDGGVGEGDG
jgi:hypothetical protein